VARQKAAPRFRALDRRLCSSVRLDEQLPSDQPVAAVWPFVPSVDRSAFEADRKSVQGPPPAPAPSTRLLVALWLFAGLDSVCLRRRATLDGTKRAGKGAEPGQGAVKRTSRDSAGVAAWRVRMAAEARAIDQQRRAGQIIDARLTPRKWRRFRWRGWPKVNAEALGQSLAHNLKRLLEMGRGFWRGDAWEMRIVRRVKRCWRGQATIGLCQRQAEAEETAKPEGQAPKRWACQKSCVRGRERV
jgi:hypothetical protein